MKSIDATFASSASRMAPGASPRSLADLRMKVGLREIFSAILSTMAPSLRAAAISPWSVAAIASSDAAPGPSSSEKCATRAASSMVTRSSWRFAMLSSSASAASASGSPARAATSASGRLRYVCVSSTALARRSASGSRAASSALPSRARASACLARAASSAPRSPPATASAKSWYGAARVFDARDTTLEQYLGRFPASPGSPRRASRRQSTSFLRQATATALSDTAGAVAPTAKSSAASRQRPRPQHTTPP
mmetsp:Transcript_18665/g.64793  ORF Transcript_18665/g.64793 Transcript_18665/m.64793 type:complete len:252 (-) Transcript_18665:84-839(-)